MDKPEPKWFFYLILCICLGLQLKAQAQGPLEKKISINLNNENLKTALDKITALSGVKFTYNEQVARSNVKTTINANNKKLKEILTELFADKPYSFTVLDKEIFIRFDPSKVKKSEAGSAADRDSGHGNFTLSGFIKSRKTGETLIAATMKVAGSSQSTWSNEYGFYSLTLPSGSYYVEVKAIGFKKYHAQIDLVNNTNLSINMEEDVQELETVNITSSSQRREIENTQMGTDRLSMNETKDVPVVFGERDLIKTIQLLPGVKTGGEGDGGFYVRGGSIDQNMILLDEAPVYNTSHLFGFFSTFNTDAVKNVTLYKGDIPAQYGGGLSSVLDVKLNDGNNQKFGVSGGIGLIAGRLNVEGPIQK
eukprot:gene13521-16470_t